MTAMIPTIVTRASTTCAATASTIRSTVQIEYAGRRGGGSSSGRGGVRSYDTSHRTTELAERRVPQQCLDIGDWRIGVYGDEQLTVVADEEPAIVHLVPRITPVGRVARLHERVLIVAVLAYLPSMMILGVVRPGNGGFGGRPSRSP